MSVLNVLPKLTQRDKSTYEAAIDLGAKPVQAYFKLIVSGHFRRVSSQGFLTALKQCRFDDFTITYFTQGRGDKDALDNDLARAQARLLA